MKIKIDLFLTLNLDYVGVVVFEGIVPLSKVDLYFLKKLTDSPGNQCGENAIEYCTAK